MKTKILLMLLMITGSAYSQLYSIEYACKTGNVITTFDLFVEYEKSYWINKEKTCDEFSPLIKHMTEERSYFREQFFNKIFHVSDSLHPFEWELTSETTVILEQNCQSAQVSFRGRDYQVFFAPDLPLNNGPWKFGGLPGLILSVKSSDGYLVYTATSISTPNKTFKPPCNFSGVKFLTWPEFKESFKAAVNAMIKHVKSSGMVPNDGSSAIKIEAPEMIYPPIQEGKGIVIEL